MKTSMNISVAVLMMTSFIATAQQYDDDIYHSPKDTPETVPVTPPPAEKKQQDENYDDQRRRFDDNQNSNSGGGYYDDRFDYDDYYDYAYAVRLRRFYGSCGSFSYFDPYYTNSYWYNYNPNYWGVSVYLGYNWWGPSYYAYSYYPSYFWSGGWGYGWGYNGWNAGWGWGGYYGYSNYYPGWHGGGWHGSSYRHGYNHGYNHGYANGYNDGIYNNYYYNSYDDNSHYYGPRGSVSSNGPRPAHTGSGAGGFGKKYQETTGFDPGSNERRRLDAPARPTNIGNTGTPGNDQGNIPVRRRDDGRQINSVPRENRGNNEPRKAEPVREYRNTPATKPSPAPRQENRTTQPSVPRQQENRSAPRPRTETGSGGNYRSQPGVSHHISPNFSGGARSYSGASGGGPIRSGGGRR